MDFSPNFSISMLNSSKEKVGKNFVPHFFCYIQKKDKTFHYALGFVGLNLDLYLFIFYFSTMFREKYIQEL